jgi:hypothetical protein
MPSANDACTKCVESSCGSQVTAAYGSGFASGNISGGACGGFITCAANCACDDTTCAENCVGKLDMACQSAEEAAGSCIDAKCSVCNGDDAGTATPPADSGSSSSGSGSACNTGDGLCFQTGYPASACAQLMGTSMSSCPTAGLLGCCKMSGLEECFYAPQTATTAMGVCSDESGTFSTGL